MLSGTVSLVLLLTVAAVAVADSTLEDCLERGSADCARDYVTKGVRSLLGDESADLLEEVISRKEETADGSAVSEQSESGGKALSVKDPKERGRVLGGTLAGDGSLTSGRSFDIGLGEDKVNNISGVTVEGRGKKMKKILEYLIALKMLYFIWGMVGYVLVALVAKTALLKSSLALGLAGLFLLRKLLMHSFHHVVTRHGAGVHHEPPVVTNYGPPMGGGSYGHPDQHGGSGMAYSAHHPDRR